MPMLLVCSHLNLNPPRFRWEQTNSIDTQTDFGISEQERIQNYPALFSANLGSSTLNIEGQTLPYHGDKQGALKPLYALAALRQSLPLTNGNGKYFGRFVIVKISEKQAVFTPNGAFFTQSFSLELKRDYDG